MEKLLVKYEHTDTFGGEANYSWVNRGEFTLPLDATHQKIVKQVKSRLGLSGVRSDSINFGDMIEIRPRQLCQVIFITFETLGE